MLSKSQFIRGCQCHKSLWLDRHRPELRDEISDAQEARFVSGTEVGQLAQQLFSGGIEFAYGDGTLTEQLQRTAMAVAAGATTLYEATFEHQGVLVKTDILHPDPNGWQLYEVKSATSLKEVYLDDIAVQWHVLCCSGLAPARASLVLINSDYVRHGELDVQQLFTLVDVTDEILVRQDFVHEEIARQLTLLEGDMPVIEIGPHCSDPYDCDFAGHCWAHIPTPSVFDLRDLGKPDPFVFYQQGILCLEDVPIEKLGWRQQLQVAGTLHQENHYDLPALREFLADLEYPLSYLDFESTYMTPIPLYDRSRPYQQIVFQFSLHVQDEPGGLVRHYAFLGEPEQGDPRPFFAEELLRYLPTSGSIVAYNQKFEIGRLNELATDFPEFADRLATLLGRFVDLMRPFQRKNLYLWQMDGSYSLKAVLPALVPELSYEELKVANGEEASSAWLRLLNDKNTGECARLRQAMLEYCHLDTWAMVCIVDKLRRLVAHGPDRTAE